VRGRLGILACVALAGPARAAGPEVISPAADSVSVTIYRDLFALVTETRTVELPEGPVTLSFDGVVETLLPASAVVADTGRSLEERNHDYDALTPESLFRQSIGREVLLTRTQKRTGKVVQTAAVIVAADHRGVILHTREGHEALYCSGLPEQVTFETIPDGLQQKPRLSVQLGAGPAGKRTVRLSYLAQGFAWKSDYVARLAEQGDRIDLKGWLTLRNLTNTSFRQASVQVVAGRLHLLDEDDGGTSTFGPSEEYLDEYSLRSAREDRLGEILEEQLEEAEDHDGEPTLLYGCFHTPPFITQTTAIQAEDIGRLGGDGSYELDEVVVTGIRASMAVREELADYQLYRLPWPTDLAARQTKQAVFLDKRNVKVERFYGLNFDAYAHSDGEEYTTVLRLGFENRKASGLGEPLPEGVLRLFEPSPTGDLFSGEGAINDTAVSEPVEVPLAGAVDLDLGVTVDADSEENSLRATETHIARTQVRIANAKGVPVTVEIRQRVHEHFANARIVRANHRTLRKFGDYAWRLRVPANSAETLDYEIRFIESDD
jgi:hypothetical protein